MTESAQTAFLDHVLARRLSGVAHDFGKPEMVWQFVALVAAMLLAWGVAKLLERAVEARRARAGRAPGPGADSLRRALFPLAGGALVWVAQLALEDWIPTSLLRLTLVPFFGIGLIYVLFFVARRVFARDGRTVAWLSVVERIVSVVVWVGMVLTVLGIQDDVVDWLGSVQFRVANTRLSLLSVLSGLLWVCVTLLVASWLDSLIDTRLKRATQLDANLRVALGRVTRALLIVIAVLVSLSLVGIDLTVLSVFGGALGVGLGFGLQKVASNYVSGFIILLDHSLHIGDAISVSGQEGVVTQIRTRYTVVRALNGNETLIPNEKLITDIVQNESSYLTRGYVKAAVQVAYDTDIEQALNLLVEATRDVPRVLEDPEPTPYLVSFDADGIDLELGFWVADSATGTARVRSNVNRNIWRLFKENNISIPFPQREVRVIGLPDGLAAPGAQADGSAGAAVQAPLPAVQAPVFDAAQQPVAAAPANGSAGVS